MVGVGVSSLPLRKLQKNDSSVTLRVPPSLTREGLGRARQRIGSRSVSIENLLVGFGVLLDLLCDLGLELCKERCVVGLAFEHIVVGDLFIQIGRRDRVVIDEGGIDDVEHRLGVVVAGDLALEIL